MNSLQKLIFVDSLKDIDQFLIKKSIREFFLFDFIKNGFIYNSQTDGLKENLLIYINDWFFNNRDTFLTNYKLIYDNLSNSRVDNNGVICYPKYLFELLDKAFLFNGIPGCNFNSDFNDKDNFVNKIKKELNKLYANRNEYIGEYNKEEIVNCIALVEFYLKYKERLTALSSNNDISLLTFDQIYSAFNSTTFSDILSYDVDKTIILNKYSKILNEFSILVDNNLETLFTNAISKFIYDIETQIEEIKFVYSSELNRELVHYIRNNMVKIYNNNLIQDFKNKTNMMSVLNKSSELFLKEKFFNPITPQNNNSNNLYPLFNKTKINEIYSRHLSNINFDRQPEHFNIAIENLKNIYMNDLVLTRSLFSSNFIEFKLNQYFAEYITYLIYGKWLELLEDTRTTIENDTNGLVPLILSNYQDVKTFLVDLLLHFPKDYDSNDYSIEEIEEAFNPVKRNFNNELNRKYRLRTIIMIRLETFKYYRFELNGLTEYDQYKILFYDFISKFVENLNQNKIIEMIQGINSLYEEI